MTRILMISPHPTYSPRGTPISVLNRCRALSALGFEVDLVTYGIGTDVPVPGLRYLRAPVPGITAVRVGPSLAKIPLNLAVFLKAFLLLVRGHADYDLVHSHEEAGPVGALYARLFHVPHVYDMGNDLDVVLGNYGLGRRHPLRALARWIEDVTIRSSRVVIAHFPALTARVAAAGSTLAGSSPAVQVVFNVAVTGDARAEQVAELRERWSPDGTPLVLYVGTFETYQGLDLLLDAAALATAEYRLVLAGGTAEQQQAYAARAAALGLTSRVLLAGRLDPAVVPSALEAADVLVSPRAVGTNTPLKVFEYLRSGTTIVATAIESHTSVLDDNVAVLAEPTAVALAAALDRAVAGGDDVAKLGSAAQELARLQYSLDSYVDGVAAAYAGAGWPSAISPVQAGITLSELREAS